MKKPNAILRVFVNVSMQNGHVGLTTLAKRHGIKVEKLEAGEFVLFINSARNKMKALGAYDVLSYVSKHERLSLDAVKFIPAAFQANQRFSYDEALALAVNEALKKGQRKTLEVF